MPYRTPQPFSLLPRESVSCANHAHGVNLGRRNIDIHCVDPAWIAWYLAAHSVLPGLSPMSDLSREFYQAAEDVRRLGTRPDNDTLLKLYALYKQGAEGNQQNVRPGFFDFVGTAKHEAWARLQGLPQEEAMRRYIELVHQLLA